MRAVSQQQISFLFVFNLWLKLLKWKLQIPTIYFILFFYITISLRLMLNSYFKFFINSLRDCASSKTVENNDIKRLG